MMTAVHFKPETGWTVDIRTLLNMSAKNWSRRQQRSSTRHSLVHHWSTREWTMHWSSLTGNYQSLRKLRCMLPKLTKVWPLCYILTIMYCLTIAAGAPLDRAAVVSRRPEAAAVVDRVTSLNNISNADDVSKNMHSFYQRHQANDVTGRINNFISSNPNTVLEGGVRLEESLHKTINTNSQGGAFLKSTIKMPHKKISKTTHSYNRQLEEVARHKQLANLNSSLSDTANFYRLMKIFSKKLTKQGGVPRSRELLFQPSPTLSSFEPGFNTWRRTMATVVRSRSKSTGSKLKTTREQGGTEHKRLFFIQGQGAKRPEDQRSVKTGAMTGVITPETTDTPDMQGDGGQNAYSDSKIQDIGVDAENGYFDSKLQDIGVENSENGYFDSKLQDKDVDMNTASGYRVMTHSHDTGIHSDLDMTNINDSSDDLPGNMGQKLNPAEYIMKDISTTTSYQDTRNVKDMKFRVPVNNKHSDIPSATASQSMNKNLFINTVTQPGDHAEKNTGLVSDSPRASSPLSRNFQLWTSLIARQAALHSLTPDLNRSPRDQTETSVHLHSWQKLSNSLANIIKTIKRQNTIDSKNLNSEHLKHELFANFQDFQRSQLKNIQRQKLKSDDFGNNFGYQQMDVSLTDTPHKVSNHNRGHMPRSKISLSQNLRLLLPYFNNGERFKRDTHNFPNMHQRHLRYKREDGTEDDTSSSTDSSLQVTTATTITTLSGITEKSMKSTSRIAPTSIPPDSVVLGAESNHPGVKVSVSSPAALSSAAPYTTTTTSVTAQIQQDTEDKEVPQGQDPRDTPPPGGEPPGNSDHALEVVTNTQGTPPSPPPLPQSLPLVQNDKVINDTSLPETQTVKSSSVTASSTTVTTTVMPEKTVKTVQGDNSENSSMDKKATPTISTTAPPSQGTTIDTPPSGISTTLGSALNPDPLTPDLSAVTEVMTPQAISTDSSNNLPYPTVTVSEGKMDAISKTSTQTTPGDSSGNSMTNLIPSPSQSHGTGDKYTSVTPASLVETTTTKRTMTTTTMGHVSKDINSDNEGTVPLTTDGSVIDDNTATMTTDINSGQGAIMTTKSIPQGAQDGVTTQLVSDDAITTSTLQTTSRLTSEISTEGADTKNNVKVTTTEEMHTTNPTNVTFTTTSVISVTPNVAADLVSTVSMSDVTTDNSIKSDTSVTNDYVTEGDTTVTATNEAVTLSNVSDNLTTPTVTVTVGGSGDAMTTQEVTGSDIPGYSTPGVTSDVVTMTTSSGVAMEMQTTPSMIITTLESDGMTSSNDNVTVVDNVVTTTPVYMDATSYSNDTTESLSSVGTTDVHSSTVATATTENTTNGAIIDNATAGQVTTAVTKPDVTTTTTIDNETVDFSSTAQVTMYPSRNMTITANVDSITITTPDDVVNDTTTAAYSDDNIQTTVDVTSSTNDSSAPVTSSIVPKTMSTSGVTQEVTEVSTVESQSSSSVTSTISSTVTSPITTATQTTMTTTTTTTVSTVPYTPSSSSSSLTTSSLPTETTTAAMPHTNATTSATTSTTKSTTKITPTASSTKTTVTNATSPWKPPVTMDTTPTPANNQTNETAVEVASAGLSPSQITGIATGSIIGFWLILGPAICIMCKIRDKRREAREKSRQMGDNDTSTFFEEMVFMELARARAKKYNTEIDDEGEVEKLTWNYRVDSKGVMTSEL